MIKYPPKILHLCAKCPINLKIYIFSLPKIIHSIFQVVYCNYCHQNSIHKNMNEYMQKKQWFCHVEPFHSYFIFINKQDNFLQRR